MSPSTNALRLLARELARTGGKDRLILANSRPQTTLNQNEVIYEICISNDRKGCQMVCVRPQNGEQHHLFIE